MTLSSESALRDAELWVSGVVRELVRAPWPVAAGVALAGLAVLLVGARARRPVAVAGAAGVAAVAAGLLSPRLPAVASMPASTVAAVAAVAGGALAAAIPQVFPALAGALPGALLAELLAPDGRRAEAIAAGAVLGAVAGLLLARWVAAGVAACAGALAVAVGTAGALHETGAGRALVRHPASILAVTVVLGVAGAAFQASRAWGRGSPVAGGKGPVRIDVPKGPAARSPPPVTGEGSGD